MKIKKEKLADKSVELQEEIIKKMKELAQVEESLFGKGISKLKRAENYKGKKNDYNLTFTLNCK